MTTTAPAIPTAKIPYAFGSLPRYASRNADGVSPIAVAITYLDQLISVKRPST